MNHALKKCQVCKVEKSVDDFHRDRTRPDGVGERCKDCVRSRNKAWNEKNPVRRKELSDNRYWSDPEGQRSRYRDYYSENTELVLQKGKDRYDKDPSKNRARKLRWISNNPGKVNAQNAARYARKIRQTLPLTKEQRDEVTEKYVLAARLTRDTGVVHHVDHVVPLKGKTVSGLHVPWNLEVKTARENLTKGARF